MKMAKLMVAAGALTLSATVQASSPLPAESVSTIAAALPRCTGGWIEAGKGRRGMVGPAELVPRLALLARPSSELDDAAGSDLYQIAKALLVPATGAPDWFLDGRSFLKCPAHPREAVALMEYLVGEGPNEWRGFINAFDWLGLAYETGAVGAPDPVKARRYYLRSRLHSWTPPRNDRWSDGIDKDLIANAERAGLLPYLNVLAQSSRGSTGARMALAEAALPTDPAKARRFLRHLDDRSLNRLVELEDQGRVPVVADADDIAFWAEASRTLFGYRKWAARMLKGVRMVNGGSIPTALERPPIDTLRPYLDEERVADVYATRDPVPVRALVTPEGRAIYIEACRATPGGSNVGGDALLVSLDAARLYNLANISRLPKLPVTQVEGRPAYGWVVLPAVHFTRSDDGKLAIGFANLAADRCVYSGIVDVPTLPVIK